MNHTTNPQDACRSTQHCAYHGWCRRCDPAFAETMSQINVAIQRTDGDESHWGPLYEAVAKALRAAVLLSVVVSADRATLRAAEAPTDWIDGHPQLEALAAAVWEKCGRSDSGTCVEDDPRNIAVAALTAVLSEPADGSSRVAAEPQCGCGHAADEHSVYGCIDGCGCDRMFKRSADSRPRCPDCQMTHDLTPGMALACASIRASIADQQQPAVAEQPDTQTREARPPAHRWWIETLDNAADEWAPGTRYTDRTEALERYGIVSAHYPLWKDGTPVQRRFVRETTSYTVEDSAP